MPIEACTLPGGGSGWRWGASGKCYADRADAEKQAAAAHANGYTGDEKIAFDRASVRRIDQDGHLFVEITPISKANICPYLGSEIPGAEALGLEPDRVYQLLRDPDELAKAAPTFAGKPLLLIHTPVSAADHPREVVIGAIGSGVKFEAPYLMAPLSVWDGEGIKLIESGEQQELSCGYRYRADMTPGTYLGADYDGVMRDIIGNHLTIVKEGRAGNDVIVADSKPKELSAMKTVLLSRKAAVAQGALMAFLSTRLAKDAQIDLAGALDGVTTKNYVEKKPAIIAAVTKAAEGKLAKDASLADMHGLLDSLDKVEPTEGKDAETVVDPNAAVPKKATDDAEPADLPSFLKSIGATDDDIAKAVSLAGGPKAADAESDEDKKKREAAEAAAKKPAQDAKTETKDMVSKSAMDAAIKTETKKAEDAAITATMKRLTDIRIAERAVAPLIGEVAVGMDSAAAIYLAALKANGIATDGVSESAYPALVAMLVKHKAETERPHAQRPQVLATDAASIAAFEKSIGDDRTIRQL